MKFKIFTNLLSKKFYLNFWEETLMKKHFCMGKNKMNRNKNQVKNSK